MLSYEKRKQILQDLEGCTFRDFQRIEYLFKGNLVYLPSREPSCVEAAVKANLQAYEEWAKEYKEPEWAK